MSNGYTYCPCRDCSEITMDGDYCDGCKAAGCPDYQGQPGMSQECQSEHAYGGDENCCPVCGKWIDTSQGNYDCHDPCCDSRGGY